MNSVFFQTLLLLSIRDITELEAVINELQRTLCSEIGGLGWVGARRVKDAANKILNIF